MLPGWSESATAAAGSKVSFPLDEDIHRGVLVENRFSVTRTVRGKPYTTAPTRDTHFFKNQLPMALVHAPATLGADVVIAVPYLHIRHHTRARWTGEPVDLRRCNRDDERVSGVLQEFRMQRGVTDAFFALDGTDWDIIVGDSVRFVSRCARGAAKHLRWDVGSSLR